MIKLSVTDHAKQRGRERNSWEPCTLEQMMEQVFYDGLAVTECWGQLRIYLQSRTADGSDYTLRIYGNDLFIFARPEPDEARLVTLYPLPLHLHQIAHEVSRNQHALAA